MTTSARICTVMFGSMPLTAVWEVAVHAAVDGKPPTELVAAGAAPQVIAALVLVLMALDPMNRRGESTPQPAGPMPRQVVRQVTAPSRRELAR